MKSISSRLAGDGFPRILRPQEPYLGFPTCWRPILTTGDPIGVGLSARATDAATRDRLVDRGRAAPRDSPRRDHERRYRAPTSERSSASHCHTNQRASEPSARPGRSNGRPHRGSRGASPRRKSDAPPLLRVDPFTSRWPTGAQRKRSYICCRKRTIGRSGHLPGPTANLLNALAVRICILRPSIHRVERVQYFRSPQFSHQPLRDWRRQWMCFPTGEMTQLSF